MKALLTTPLQEILVDAWNRIDAASRKAFFAVLVVSILAFGFEATNLTLHHDDLVQIFIQSTILGHYLGRFGTGWIHWYTQNAYFMPFIQMAEGIVIMSTYGVLVARFWGLRNAWEIALAASIMCVFPYMAQVYQYNTTMATYSVAHLMAAGAVILSVRGRILGAVAAALLFAGAFSIYQSVAGNAATIFLIWLLAQAISAERDGTTFAREALRATSWILGCVLAGGSLYLLCVSFMDIRFDDYQAAGEAFNLKGAAELTRAVPDILLGTRRFLLWPEPYFPNYLKLPQLLMLGGAAIGSGLIAKGLARKAAALGLLVAACFSPRALQLLHSGGHYHELTLTAYAVLVAGTVMATQKVASTLARNASGLVAVFLIAGYLVQCNAISTVNYLNTAAHFSTVTQILARLRSLPSAEWDGKSIVVVGRYDMGNEHPFRRATGVASEYMDAHHMDLIARVLRDEARFVESDESSRRIMAYAASHDRWPHPDSVAVIDGTGVVILSKK